MEVSVQSGLSSADANRMLCELASVEVACETCGRESVLGFQQLQRATFSGVYSYSMLAERLKCSECPPTPRSWRKLELRPQWRNGA